MDKKYTRQQLFISLLHKKGCLHMVDILQFMESEGIEVDSRTVQRDIKELGSLISKSGKGKNTRYFLKKNKLKIFISMPFTGKNYQDLVNERRGLSVLVDSFGFDLVEQFIGYQFEEDFMSKSLDPSFIVGKDKNWIKESDVVVADLTSHSIGAYQEIVLAKELFNKKVYAVVSPEKRFHYWLRFYTDFFFDTIEDALKQIKIDFDNKYVDKMLNKNQYDPIAVEYKRIEKTDVQKCVYDYELEKFLKEHAKGKRVIVLHCGSGYRARIASKYAKSVIGIDLSFRQIFLAQLEEEKNPKNNVTYHTLDPYFTDFKSEINRLEVKPADIVVGFFLLDHSRNKEELSIVIDNCKYLLKNGGLFLGMVDNLDITIPSEGKYGVVVNSGVDGAVQEGESRRISIFENHKEVLHFHNYARSKETFKNIFAEANFDSFSYRNAVVSVDLKDDYPKDFWRSYEEDPTQGIIVAKK